MFLYKISKLEALRSLLRPVSTPNSSTIRYPVLLTVTVVLFSATKQVEWIGSTHANLLFELWYESDDCVTRQAASDRQQDVRWLQVRAWYDHSCIAGESLLAHGLTVKLSTCPCSHNGLAG